MKKQPSWWLRLCADGSTDAQQWDVDRAVLVSGLFFLLVSAAGAALSPFLPVYLSALGLTPLHLGLVASARTLAHLMCSPVLSRCAARGRRRRLAMLLALACSAVATLGLTAVPAMPPRPHLLGSNTTATPTNRSSFGESAAVPGVTRVTPGMAVIGDAHPTVPLSGTISQASSPNVPPFIARSPSFGIGRSPSSASRSSFGGEVSDTSPSHDFSGGSVSTAPVNAKSARPDTFLPTAATDEARLNDLRVTVTVSTVSPEIGEEPDWHPSLRFLTSSTALLPSAESGAAAPTTPNKTLMTLPSSVLDGENDEEKGTKVMATMEMSAFHAEDNGGRAARAIAPIARVPLTSPSPPAVGPTVGSGPAIAVLSAVAVLSPWHVFALVLAVTTLGAALASPLLSLANNSLYEYLDQVDATDRYGQHEQWGLLGVAVAALSACALSQQLDSMLPQFYASSALLGAALLAALAYPVPSAAAPGGSPATSLRRALRRVACSSDAGTLLCIPTLLLLAAAGAVVDCFIFCRMRELGASYLLMGAAVSAATTGELLLTGLHCRGGGGVAACRCWHWPVKLNVGAAALGVAVFAAQILAFSLLRVVWALALVYATSSLGAPLARHALLRRVGLECPQGMCERAVRSAVWALALGLGAGVGALVGGVLVQSVGVERTFQGCAALLVAWATVLGLVQARVPRPKGLRYSRLLSNESDASDSGDERAQDWLVQALEDADR